MPPACSWLGRRLGCAPAAIAGPSRQTPPTTLAPPLQLMVVVPFVIPVFLPLGIAFFWVRRRYLATSREVKRFEATTRSPVFASFSALLKVGGRAVEWAFGCLRCVLPPCAGCCCSPMKLCSCQRFSLSRNVMCLPAFLPLWAATTGAGPAHHSCLRRRRPLPLRLPTRSF